MCLLLPSFYPRLRAKVEEHMWSLLQGREQIQDVHNVQEKDYKAWCCCPHHTVREMQAATMAGKETERRDKRKEEKETKRVKLDRFIKTEHRRSKQTLRSLLEGASYMQFLSCLQLCH